MDMSSMMGGSGGAYDVTAYVTMPEGASGAKAGKAIEELCADLPCPVSYTHLVDPDFTGFQREFFPTTYVCNTEYDASMPNVQVAWPRVAVKNGLGEYLSSLSLTQLRIAETEKYAHVTFFFNGGVEKQYPGEDRVLVPSPKVATYDLQPEMSAYEVCDKCVERINSGAYEVVILNFANCDMVGHTGVLEAAVKAVETVDTCVGLSLIHI